jgi:hypothetical protein
MTAVQTENRCLAAQDLRNCIDGRPEHIPGRPHVGHPAAVVMLKLDARDMARKVRQG